MKKLILVLLIAIICTMSVSAFAAEDLDFLKSFKKVSVKLSPVESPEAVLVVSQFKSGKLIGIEFVSIAQPDDGYTLPEFTMEDGIDYTFCVYDNMNCKNLLFNYLTVNTNTRNQLFLAEHEGNQFERVD